MSHINFETEFENFGGWQEVRWASQRDIFSFSIFDEIQNFNLDLKYLIEKKSFINFWRRFNAAATLRLGSTQLGLNKHYAAVMINKEMKTTISKFPRSNPDNFYEFLRFEIYSIVKKRLHHMICLVLVIFFIHFLNISRKKT